MLSGDETRQSRKMPLAVITSDRNWAVKAFSSAEVAKSLLQTSPAASIARHRALSSDAWPGCICLSSLLLQRTWFLARDSLHGNLLLIKHTLGPVNFRWLWIHVYIWLIFQPGLLKAGDRIWEVICRWIAGLAINSVGKQDKETSAFIFASFLQSGELVDSTACLC